jgi:AAHS family 4-hydroxybenzoate transporter-like MFS transporter
MPKSGRTIDVSSLLDQRQLSALNYAIIGLSWLITFCDGLDIMMVSFTAPYMRGELSLSNVALGQVFAAGTAGMALGGLIFAYLGDRFGRRPTIVIAAFAFGLLTLATAAAHTYAQLVVVRFADGLAIGGMLPLAWALNIEFAPRSVRSTVVAVIMMGYALGSASAAPLTIWLAPVYGWQGVYIAGGLCTLACAIGLALALPESPRFLAGRGLRPDYVATMLKRLEPSADVAPGDRFVVGDEMARAARFHVRQLFGGDLRIVTPLLWLGYWASSLASFFGANWGPSLLEALAIPRHSAGLLVSLAGLLGSAVGIGLMRINDRSGLLIVAAVPSAAAGVLMLIGFGLAPAVLFAPLFVLQGALITAGHLAIMSVAGTFYPIAIRANGCGWMNLFGKIGGIIAPLAGAAILSSGMPLERSFALLAICPVLLGLTFIVICAVKRSASRAEANRPFMLRIEM